MRSLLKFVVSFALEFEEVDVAEDLELLSDLVAYVFVLGV